MLHNTIVYQKERKKERKNAKMKEPEKKRKKERKKNKDRRYEDTPREDLLDTHNCQ